MEKFIEVQVDAGVGLIRLNRPEKLNAWNTVMRDEIVATLDAFDQRQDVRAVVMTGAGNRAFSAGQDLEEAHDFDAQRAEAWMLEWKRYYAALRGLSKPLVIALNGTAAGSAFQVALLGDIRIAHAGVRMGQPEINAGIASVTGPWIMNNMIGLSRTIELTLTGRLMDAAECERIGLIHEIVAEPEVLKHALSVAADLASKPPVAMRLNKQRFREITESGFQDAVAAGIRIQVESYGSGEPARMMEEFFLKRGGKVQFGTNA